MRDRLLLFVALALIPGCSGQSERPLNDHDRAFRAAVSGATGMWWFAYGQGERKLNEAELAEFVDLFRFEEGPAGGSCACRSQIEFGFTKDGSTSALFRLFKARGVRNVPWGEDGLSEQQAALTDESVLRVGDWFAQHGAPAALEDARFELAQTENHRSHERRLAELLPKSVREELGALAGGYDHGERAAAVLRRHEPNPAAMTTLALRLMASTWCPGAPEILDALPLAELRDALYGALADPETSRGADLWVLGHRHPRSLDRSLLSEFLRPAAERRLSDPTFGVRGAAIEGLRDADHPDALALLHEVLNGTGTADRVRVAQILVYEKEDLASFPRIRQLLSGFDEISRNALIQRMDETEESQVR